MPRYVDGYVLPIPKRKIAAYKKLAQKASKIWRQHGALEYVECAGEDLKAKWGVPFPRRFHAKPGETVVFAYIVFKSRAHRDRVNAKVMKDKRMNSMITEAMPFEPKRMTYGGFQTIVDA